MVFRCLAPLRLCPHPCVCSLLCPVNQPPGTRVAGRRQRRSPRCSSPPCAACRASLTRRTSTCAARCVGGTCRGSGAAAVPAPAGGRAPSATSAPGATRLGAHTAPLPARTTPPPCLAPAHARALSVLLLLPSAVASRWYLDATAVAATRSPVALQPPALTSTRPCRRCLWLPFARGSSHHCQCLRGGAPSTGRRTAPVCLLPGRC